MLAVLEPRCGLARFPRRPTAEWSEYERTLEAQYDSDFEDEVFATTERLEKNLGQRHEEYGLRSDPRGNGSTVAWLAALIVAMLTIPVTAAIAYAVTRRRSRIALSATQSWGSTKGWIVELNNAEQQLVRLGGQYEESL